MWNLREELSELMVTAIEKNRGNEFFAEFHSGMTSGQPILVGEAMKSMTEAILEVSADPANRMSISNAAMDGGQNPNILVAVALVVEAVAVVFVVAVPQTDTVIAQVFT